MKFPDKLEKKLQNRIQINALRKLPRPNNIVDFSSNDYLGFSRNKQLHDHAERFFNESGVKGNGATGSRLLTGNHLMYRIIEEELASRHESDRVLMFNSGYDANLGFFSCVPQRDDVVLYDELSHASIRDGIKLGNAKAYKFEHNNLEDLLALIERNKTTDSDIYVVTESVFSMDGDSPNLIALVELCEQHNCYLIVDEAHALGVFGEFGEGLVQELGLHKRVFARLITFGKSLGAHGAAILCSKQLQRYLVNYARSFIYTTALPPKAVATIGSGYIFLQNHEHFRRQLRDNIAHFNQQKMRVGVKNVFVRSTSAIHCAIVPGNDRVRELADGMQLNGFDVRAILSPTVPEGQERMRFCLHSFNTKDEISGALATFEKLLFQ